MDLKSLYKNQIKNSIPIYGMFLFIALFIYSASLYPGGSQANIHSKGFDWVNNYWCNLMNEEAMNGKPNPARPFSIIGMWILCFSLMIFFLRFAKIYPKNKWWIYAIRYGGIFSMLSASLIFTRYHDLMTTVSSIFGIFVVVGIIKEMFQSDLTFFKIGGIVCILLLALNNYIYYTHQLIDLLPLLQKITFGIVLLWVIGLNFEMNTHKGAEI